MHETTEKHWFNSRGAVCFVKLAPRRLQSLSPEYKCDHKPNSQNIFCKPKFQ